MGRATQGVKLINLKGTDAIASVAKIEHEEEEELEAVLEKLDAAEGDAESVIADGTEVAPEADDADADVEEEEQEEDDAEDADTDEEEPIN